MKNYYEICNYTFSVETPEAKAYVKKQGDFRRITAKEAQKHIVAPLELGRRDNGVDFDELLAYEKFWEKL